MFNLFEKVKIKSKNLIGTIVDISNDANLITVESDTEYFNDPDGYGERWPLFNCEENDLEKIS